ncbi:uncharacterized protein LOC111058160 [Nilaparvata lugens]|uniref:uncharacterized protein LOC111058160 n=1 Tax=Nilaparvata lugens TaxID=108931 RepID=UPI00193D90D2|nr:uncharacterized protein LOC111058160 [Nilaparvata lugens]XP_039301347.1 uncharacterized protein LOC111058160 [Nilaparvata lugens]XP_039301348.1 uncharacterized protein LOC111058160 [Nilaparvata lugens]XP_039301349.1 uncharacterized protein LOC111058160 [Nilaparvata lugens]
MNWTKRHFLPGWVYDYDAVYLAPPVNDPDIKYQVDPEPSKVSDEGPVEVSDIKYIIDTEDRLGELKLLEAVKVTSYASKYLFRDATVEACNRRGLRHLRTDFQSSTVTVFNCRGCTKIKDSSTVFVKIH